AHEFFHVVTPLNIHSEEIRYFDFINPQMSQHLWLYEGVTEYFSSHVQVHQQLISPEEFLDKVKEYITGAQSYTDSLPFTVMSKGALDVHKKEYSNVYLKGALIGLVLDLRLRELSEGKYGLKDLMADLSKTYGKDRAFKDEELFDKITELTYPEIRDFFRRYVEGTEPLPLAESFNKVGISFQREGRQVRQTLGGFTLGYNSKTNRLTVADTKDMNVFGHRMGFKKGDQLLKINGMEMTPENAGDVLDSEVSKAALGSRIVVTVNRPDAKGNLKTVKLRGRLVPTMEFTENALEFNPNATPEQLQLRQAWLFG
ncbi:MAG TPA: hypothetical protein VK927_01310, partial [Adhaeribacter sp.]|nr:hypothetical protein [Adhaeribacter sp.]